MVRTRFNSKDIIEIREIRQSLGVNYDARVKFKVAVNPCFFPASSFSPDLEQKINALGMLIYKEIPYKSKQELAPYLLDDNFLIRKAAEKRLKQLDTTVE